MAASASEFSSGYTLGLDGQAGRALGHREALDAVGVPADQSVGGFDDLGLGAVVAVQAVDRGVGVLGSGEVQDIVHLRELERVD